MGYLSISYLKVAAFILQDFSSTAPEFFNFFLNYLHIIVSVQCSEAYFVRFQPESFITGLQRARLLPFI